LACDLGIHHGLATASFGPTVDLALTAPRRQPELLLRLENFIATLDAVAFLHSSAVYQRHTLYGWLGGIPDRAYTSSRWRFWPDDPGRASLSAVLPQPGAYRFVFFRFHPLWWRMLELALLKVWPRIHRHAPAMLIMLLVGQEGTLGATQPSGVFRLPHVTVGRMTAPACIIVFSAGLLLFLLGAVTNTCSSTPWRAHLYRMSFAGQPLLDLAYYPISCR